MTRKSATNSEPVAPTDDKNVTPLRHPLMANQSPCGSLPWNKINKKIRMSNIYSVVCFVEHCTVSAMDYCVSEFPSEYSKVYRITEAHVSTRKSHRLKVSSY